MLLIRHLTYFHKAGLCELLVVCASIYDPSPLNLFMCIMELDFISTAYFISVSLQSVCICMLIGKGTAQALYRRRIYTHYFQFGPCRMLRESVALSVFATILTRKRLDEDFPLARKSCWTRHFLCPSCRS
jgi:hypothetical protein